MVNGVEKWQGLECYVSASVFCETVFPYINSALFNYLQVRSLPSENSATDLPSWSNSSYHPHAVESPLPI